MMDRTSAAARARSHYVAYRVARVVVLVAAALLALLFFAYTAFSVASVFLWSLR